MNFNSADIDWHQVHNVIDRAQRIMLTTHENPDGDGLGSEVALYHHFREIGKDVRIINYSSLPDEYNFLGSADIFETFNESEQLDWLKIVDMVIIFDVGDFDRVRGIRDIIEQYQLETMNLDHHPHPEDHPFTHNVVNIDAAATGCMVYDYLKVARSKPLTKSICTGIYTAVMTDTGCFRYSNTDEKSHTIAIECLEKGVSTHQIYQLVYENSSKARVGLLGNILTTLNYELEGQLAWFIVSQDMVKNASATNNDIEGFSDFVRTIKGVEVAIMIYEQNVQSCRINFRSKGKFKVNSIANELGGGGHAFAAGAILEGPLSELTTKIVSLSKQMIIQQVKEQT